MDDVLMEDMDPFAATAAPQPETVPEPVMEPVQHNSRKRCWFITVNNYTDETIRRIREIRFGNIIYIGWEKAPTTGMLHIHAHIAFSCPVHFQNVDRAIHKGVWNAADPNPVVGPKPNVQYTRVEAHAIKYIKKKNPDGTPKVWKCFRGVAHPQYNPTEAAANEITDVPSNPKDQGARTDLKRIHSQLLAGAGNPNSIKKVMTDPDNLSCLKFHSGIEKMASYLLPDTIGDTGIVAREIAGTVIYQPKVEYLYGKSGTGKSCKAVEIFLAQGIALEDIYFVEYQNGFFNGYSGQKFAIWDEFRASQCPLSTILKLLQGFPYKMNVKGGTVPRLVQHWIFTSIYPPWTVYEAVFQKENEEPYQWFRRLTSVTEITRFADTQTCTDRTAWFTKDALPLRLWHQFTEDNLLNAIDDDFIL